MINNDNEKNAKYIPKYICLKCDFQCIKKSNYTCHLNTNKHNNIKNDINMINNDNNKMPKNATFICECGNNYKHMSGLSRHKKCCSLLNQLISQDKSEQSLITPELVMELIKDNKELKQIILEQNNTINNLVKNSTTQIITNTNSLNNNNNKTFNLHFFLNETCKNAMNIMDFVDSIKLQVSDVIKMGELGYTQGISNIITANLKALDITQRPVHCTDKKRETMYVKDDDKWEKEDESNTKLRKVINRVSNKNIKLLPQFREKYPEYNNSSSAISDTYDKMVIEVMGGFGNRTHEKEEKIIHNISKCTAIDK